MEKQNANPVVYSSADTHHTSSTHPHGKRGRRGLDPRVFYDDDGEWKGDNEFDFEFNSDFRRHDGAVGVEGFHYGLGGRVGISFDLDNNDVNDDVLAEPTPPPSSRSMVVAADSNSDDDVEFYSPPASPVLTAATSGENPSSSSSSSSSTTEETSKTKSGNNTTNTITTPLKHPPHPPTRRRHRRRSSSSVGVGSAWSAPFTSSAATSNGGLGISTGEDGGGAHPDDPEDEIDAAEVFGLVRHIADPEHPLTLEQLHVVQERFISVTTGGFFSNNSGKSNNEYYNKNTHPHVHVQFQPTIPHCSMATLIGLCIRVKLLRSLPSRYKVKVSIVPGTHATETAVNKQLNDKERVHAALENSNLLKVVDKCIAKSCGPPNE